jgi:hypothetical protein
MSQTFVIQVEAAADLSTASACQSFLASKILFAGNVYAARIDLSADKRFSHA